MGREKGDKNLIISEYLKDTSRNRDAEVAEITGYSLSFVSLVRRECLGLKFARADVPKSLPCKGYLVELEELALEIAQKNLRERGIDLSIEEIKKLGA